jgi:aspartyl-tRNA(Asn)/glutamyl-tRNA(Gln) amidotransferase subunit A
MTIAEAAAGLRARRFSAVELATEAIACIERHDAALGTFITLTTEQALEEARQADRELAARADRGPLHGIPIALKDLFCTKGVRTTAGSKIYAGFVPEMDAAVVERLRTAGAVMLGKLNMHELAYGITSANPHFGAVRNPWDTAHSPGGSSGGSGAAVATGMVFMALGSDTGGSIRIPASFCGTVGLKPTYGRVSRYGVLPLGYSLDHVGPLTRSVRDAALTLNAIAGYDSRDPSCSRATAGDFVPAEGCSLRGVRIGVPENFFFEYLQEDVERAVRAAIAIAEGLGAVIKPVRVPDIGALNAVARMVLLSEASAVGEAFAERRSDLGSDVRALLDQGRLVAAADYVNAQRLRRQMRQEFAKLWTDVDCIVTPATPTVAPKIGDTTVRLGGRDEDVRLATTRLARGVNALGFPALSIPCGTSSEGLPVGLQIIGAAYDEVAILRTGAALEDAGVGIPACPMG